MHSWKKKRDVVRTLVPGLCLQPEHNQTCSSTMHSFLLINNKPCANAAVCLHHKCTTQATVGRKRCSVHDTTCITKGCTKRKRSGFLVCIMHGGHFVCARPFCKRKSFRGRKGNLCGLHLAVQQGNPPHSAVGHHARVFQVTHQKVHDVQGQPSAPRHV